MKRWTILAVVIVAVILIIGGVKGCQVKQMMEGFKNAPLQKFTVSAAKVAYEDWQPQQAAVGSVRALRGADLSAEVAGIVDSIEFQSGDDVKAGQPLLQLRAADDVARLDSLRASADLAGSVHQRSVAQFEAKAISKAQLDSDTATLRSAKAQVAEQQALVNKKHVAAPFAGHLGIRQVDVGQYLQPGTKIVTLQTLDPIYVDFYLPQQALAQVKTGQAVSASSDTYPDESFSGTISAIDPKVDADTRNVQLRAELGNPEHKLLPGMFANVSVAIGGAARYLTLPQTAVAYNPYGQTVFVLVTQDQFKADQEAEAKKIGQADTGAQTQQGPPVPGDQLVAKQVFVTTGATRGDQVAILKGIKEGDQVVTSGQLKLRNGMPVDVDNAVQPTFDANPAPQEQ